MSKIGHYVRSRVRGKEHPTSFQLSRLDGVHEYMIACVDADDKAIEELEGALKTDLPDTGEAKYTLTCTLADGSNGGMIRFKEGRPELPIRYQGDLVNGQLVELIGTIFSDVKGHYGFLFTQLSGNNEKLLDAVKLLVEAMGRGEGGTVNPAQKMVMDRLGVLLDLGMAAGAKALPQFLNGQAQLANGQTVKAEQGSESQFAELRNIASRLTDLEIGRLLEVVLESGLDEKLLGALEEGHRTEITKAIIGGKHE